MARATSGSVRCSASQSATKSFITPLPPGALPRPARRGRRRRLRSRLLRREAVRSPTRWRDRPRRRGRGDRRCPRPGSAGRCPRRAGSPPRRRPRPAALRRIPPVAGVSGRRSSRRASSFSVNVRSCASGTIASIASRCSDAMASDEVRIANHRRRQPPRAGGAGCRPRSRSWPRFPRASAASRPSRSRRWRRWSTPSMPNSASMLRMKPSAMGERQMFPVQTERMRVTLGSLPIRAPAPNQRDTPRSGPSRRARHEAGGRGADRSGRAPWTEACRGPSPARWSGTRRRRRRMPRSAPRRSPRGAARSIGAGDRQRPCAPGARGAARGRGRGRPPSRRVAQRQGLRALGSRKHQGERAGPEVPKARPRVGVAGSSASASPAVAARTGRVSPVGRAWPRTVAQWPPRGPGGQRCRTPSRSESPASPAVARGAARLLGDGGLEVLGPVGRPRRLGSRAPPRRLPGGGIATRGRGPPGPAGTATASSPAPANSARTSAPARRRSRPPASRPGEATAARSSARRRGRPFRPPAPRRARASTSGGRTAYLALGQVGRIADHQVQPSSELAGGSVPGGRLRSTSRPPRPVAAAFPGQGDRSRATTSVARTLASGRAYRSTASAMAPVPVPTSTTTGRGQTPSDAPAGPHRRGPPSRAGERTPRARRPGVEAEERLLAGEVLQRRRPRIAGRAPARAPAPSPRPALPTACTGRRGRCPRKCMSRVSAFAGGSRTPCRSRYAAERRTTSDGRGSAPDRSSSASLSRHRELLATASCRRAPPPAGRR